MAELIAQRYQLIDQLPNAGGRQVWRAIDMQHNDVVAVKMASPVGGRAVQELSNKLGGTINYSRLVLPTDVVRNKQQLALVLPLYTGGTVAQLNDRWGPLPLSLVATLADQLLQALEQLHALGMVHRNVVTESLLLKSTGKEHPELGLSGFELLISAKTVSSISFGNVPGNSIFPGPEGGMPTASQDLFSAGVAIVEMLSGVRPDLVRRHTWTPMLAASFGVDPHFLVFLDSLIAGTPELRPPSATAARQALVATGLLPPEGLALTGSPITIKDTMQPTAAKLLAIHLGEQGGASEQCGEVMATLTGSEQGYDIQSMQTAVLDALAMVPPAATPPARPGPGETEIRRVEAELESALQPVNEAKPPAKRLSRAKVWVLAATAVAAAALMLALGAYYL